MENELSQAEIRKIQVELLMELHRFCEENGLIYYLIGGTLLGAVRHGGYIPWDDDVDVILPRPDYDKLIATYNHKAGSHYRMISMETDENYFLPFGKLMDTRTILRVKLHVDCPIGVYLDVFPLDNLSYEHTTAQMQLHRIHRWVRMLEVKQIVLAKTRSLWKNMVLAVGKLFLLPISQRYILNKIDKLCRLHAAPHMTTCVGRAAYPQYGDKEIMHAGWFKHRVKTRFEGNKVYLPAEYDALLTQLYGDYHQLPPESERKPHHAFRAWYKEKP